MLEKLKITGIIIGTLIIFSGLIYGIWQAKRWINWNLGYANEVKQYMEPYEKRITVLENTIDSLKVVLNDN